MRSERTSTISASSRASGLAAVPMAPSHRAADGGQRVAVEIAEHLALEQAQGVARRVTVGRHRLETRDARGGGWHACELAHDSGEPALARAGMVLGEQAPALLLQRLDARDAVELADLVPRPESACEQGGAAQRSGDPAEPGSERRRGDDEAVELQAGEERDRRRQQHGEAEAPAIGRCGADRFVRCRRHVADRDRRRCRDRLARDEVGGVVEPRLDPLGLAHRKRSPTR
jgi:hypothetical protein